MEFTRKSFKIRSRMLHWVSDFSWVDFHQNFSAHFFLFAIASLNSTSTFNEKTSIEIKFSVHFHLTMSNMRKYWSKYQFYHDSSRTLLEGVELCHKKEFSLIKILFSNERMNENAVKWSEWEFFFQFSPKNLCSLLIAFRVAQ